MPSAYSGGKKRWNGMCADPQRGLRILLHVPSCVLYLLVAATHCGGSLGGHKPSNGVLFSEICFSFPFF